MDKYQIWKNILYGYIREFPEAIKNDKAHEIISIDSKYGKTLSNVMR